MPVTGGLLQSPVLSLQSLSGGFSPNEGKSKEQLGSKGGEEKEQDEEKRKKQEKEQDINKN